METNLEVRPNEVFFLLWVIDYVFLFSCLDLLRHGAPSHLAEAVGRGEAVPGIWEIILFCFAFKRCL